MDEGKKGSQSGGGYQEEKGGVQGVHRKLVRVAKEKKKVVRVEVDTREKRGGYKAYIEKGSQSG